MLADDDDEAVAQTATKSQTSQQPAWMRTLLERCREWLTQLPAVRFFFCAARMYVLILAFQTFETLAKQSAEHQDPLYRLFAREGDIGAKLLRHVRKDLQDVTKVCLGDLKQTNHLRTLMSALTKGATLQLKILDKCSYF